MGGKGQEGVEGKEREGGGKEGDRQEMEGWGGGKKGGKEGGMERGVRKEDGNKGKN